MGNIQNSFMLVFIILVFSTCGVALADDTNSTVFKLYAGKNIEVGNVTVSNDCDYLNVTYRTNANWSILETHLEVANSFENISMTKSGNPIPGHFAYKNESLPEGTHIQEYVIPLSSENGTLYIAAHATVKDELDKGDDEGAWAEGISFPGGTWATYFMYDLVCENDDSGESQDNDDGSDVGDDVGDGSDAGDGSGDDSDVGDGSGDDSDAGDGSGDDSDAGDGSGDDSDVGDGSGDDSDAGDGSGDDSDAGDDVGDGSNDSGAASPGSSGSKGGSGISHRSVAPEDESEPSNDDNTYMAFELEEEEEPETPAPAPEAEPEEHNPFTEVIPKISKTLWFIIWALLSAICVMSGYGLTQP